MFHENWKNSLYVLVVSLLFFHGLPGFFFLSSSYGQDQPPELSLEDAFRTALSRNPAVNQASASRKKAVYEVKKSISAFLPRVDLEAGVSRSNNPVMVFGSKLNQAAFTEPDFAVERLNDPDYRDNWQARLVMTQPIFNQGREYIGYKTSRLMEDMSELYLNSSGQAVLFTVERAYCEALLAQEKVEVLNAALKTARAHEKLSEKRYEAGLVLKSDVLSADVRKISTERQLFKAENDLRIATAALNRAMGVAQEKSWRLDRLDNENREHGSLESWLREAKKNRPEILMARDDLSIAEYHHRQAKFRFLPSFNLHGIYQQDRENFSDFGGDSWTFMATMSMNLFNGFGDTAQVSAAGAEIDKKAARLKEVESNIELEVRKAFYEFQTAKRQMKVTRQSVRQAEESQRILRNRYENGLALMVELLAADTNAMETKLQEARARFDARLAWSELNWKAGLLGRDIIDTAGCTSY